MSRLPTPGSDSGVWGDVPVRLLSPFAILVGIVVLFAPTSIAAQSSSTIAQGFTASASKGEIVAGALVSLKEGTQSVELATTETADQLMGVVDQSPLLLISEATQEAQVVLSGTTNLLVSDINGAVKAGDRITASPVAGVGMRATSSSRVIGIVQSDFDTRTAQAQDVVDSRGGKHVIHIGRVAVQVALANYQAPGSDFLPPFIQDIANNIAGRQVSIVRVLISTMIVIISFVGMAVFIFSSARSAMISIGRNPLASAHIRRSLYQVGAITISVWGGALLACYLILTF